MNLALTEMLLITIIASKRKSKYMVCILYILWLVHPGNVKQRKKPAALFIVNLSLEALIGQSAYELIVRYMVAGCYMRRYSTHSFKFEK